MGVGVPLVARGARERGGDKGIISKSQAGQHHPAWPPVSEEREKVNTPAVSAKVIRFHFVHYCSV